MLCFRSDKRLRTIERTLASCNRDDGLVPLCRQDEWCQGAAITSHRHICPERRGRRQLELQYLRYPGAMSASLSARA